MSKLAELIQQYCPDGVEGKRLKDVCSDFIVPMRDRPKVFDGDIPWCRIEDKQGQFFNGSLSGLGVSEKVIKQMNLKVFPTGTVICSCSASLGTYAINTRPLITNQTFIGIVCGESIFNKYLLYFMETQTSKLISLSNSGTIPYVSRKKFEELEIPVPPLPVQEEIVRILDNFTELQAELQAELQKRKQQYEYYKWNILEGLSCPTKHITDVALVKARVGWQRLTTAEYQSTGDYYLITGTDFKNGKIDFGNCVFVSKERYEMDPNIIVGKGDILITKDGTLGKVAFLEDEPNKPTTLNSGVFRIHTADPNVSPRYLFHYFTSKYFTDFVNSVKTGSTIPHLTQQGLVSLNIPIPSLEEQNRVVSILDRFDTLTNDITAGLPAEIEARRKQYEYYRDQLLTFKQKA